MIKNVLHTEIFCTIIEWFDDDLRLCVLFVPTSHTHLHATPGPYPKRFENGAGYRVHCLLSPKCLCHGLTAPQELTTHLAEMVALWEWGWLGAGVMV